MLSLILVYVLSFQLTYSLLTLREALSEVVVDKMVHQSLLASRLGKMFIFPNISNTIILYDIRTGYYTSIQLRGAEGQAAGEGPISLLGRFQSPGENRPGYHGKGGAWHSW